MTISKWDASAGQRRIIASARAGHQGLPIGYAVLLRGALDVSQMARAADAVIRKHVAVQTRFVIEPDRVVQEAASFRAEDIFTFAVDRREPDAILADLRSRPFDIARGPLIRITLHELRGGAGHLLTILAHHLIVDGWSIHQLGKELARNYGAASSTSGERKASSRAFADYVEDEQRLLAGVAAEQRASFWKNKYGSTAAARQRLPATRSEASRSLTTALSVPRAALLTPEEHARQNATHFEVLLAAYVALIRRLTGNGTVWVEIPFADRRSMRNARTIGLLVQMVPLAFEVHADTSFADIRKQIREWVQAIAENFLPDIASHCDLMTRQRGASRHDSAFNLIPWSCDRVAFKDLEVEEVACPEAPPDVGIAVYVRERADRFEIKLSYRTADFSVGEAEEILQQFQLMIDHSTRHVDASVSEPSLLTEQARRALPDPRHTKHSYRMMQVGARLEQRFQAEPAAHCYEERSHKISISDLYAARERLVGVLAAGGARRGDIVAVLPLRGSLYPALLLALWKIGAVAALVDPQLPEARIKRCLRRVQPRFVIQLGSHSLTSPEVRLEAWTAPEMPRAEGESPRIEPPLGDDDALILFTSGSSGEPRAIRSTHSGLAHFLEWQTSKFGIGKQDRVSAVSGLAHDPILRDMFLPVWSGAVGISEEIDVRDLSAARMQLAAASPTVIHATPSLARALLSRDLPLHGTRLIFLAGEAVEHETVTELRQAAPGAQIVNFYGATETPQAMSFHVSAETSRPNGTRYLPIGKGIADVSLLVLNHAHSLAGIGEVGEIAVDTPYLSNGYLGDPDAMAARFVRNSFRQDNSIIYRTGDLGYYLPEGDVVYVRRNDDQLKIDGVRIEPAEVKFELERYAGVRQAHVMSVAEANGRVRLVAFVVSAAPSSEKVTQAEFHDSLRAQLQQNLPRASLPSEIIAVDTMPLSVNGKIDERSLLRIAEERSSRSVDITAVDGTAARVRDIVHKAMRHDAIGPSDNLAEFGMTSLQAMEIIADVERQLGVRLRPEAFLFRPTILSLAVLVDTLSAALQPVGEAEPWYEDRAI